MTIKTDNKQVKSHIVQTDARIQRHTVCKRDNVARNVSLSRERWRRQVVGEEEATRSRYARTCH